MIFYVASLCRTVLWNKRIVGSGIRADSVNNVRGEQVLPTNNDVGKHQQFDYFFYNISSVHDLLRWKLV